MSLDLYLYVVYAKGCDSCVGLYIFQVVRLSIAAVLSRTVMTIGPLITGLPACTM